MVSTLRSMSVQPHPRTPADPQFTPRQRQVLNLLVRRYSNAEIAAELGVSLDGAKWHVREIMSILGAGTREDAAEFWREYNGLPARLRRVRAALFALPLVRPAAMAAGGLLVAGVLVAMVALLRDSNEPDTTPAAGVSPTATTTQTQTPAPSRTLTPTATPTAEGPPAIPREPLATHPVGTRLGNSIIDAVINAFEQQDQAALMALVTPLQARCTTDGADYQRPACEAGVPAGTPVDVLFGIGCEGGWLDLSLYPSTNWHPMVEAPYHLYAITDHSGPTFGLAGGDVPVIDPGAWVIFVTNDLAQPEMAAVGVTAEGVIALAYSCSSYGIRTLVQYASPDATYLLAPLQFAASAD